MDIQDRTAIVTAAEAQRTANKFLAMEVGIAFSATDPVFIPMVEPVWQFSIRFRLPRLGTLATLGTIDVNANTRTVLPLAKTRIREIQKRANALVEHTPSFTTA